MEKNLLIWSCNISFCICHVVIRRRHLYLCSADVSVGAWWSGLMRRWWLLGIRIVEKQIVGVGGCFVVYYSRSSSAEPGSPNSTHSLLRGLIRTAVIKHTQGNSTNCWCISTSNLCGPLRYCYMVCRWQTNQHINREHQHKKICIGSFL